MTWRTAYRKQGLKATLLVLMNLGNFACAAPSRVGVLTYENAVAELGPPDGETTLRDGRHICQWTSGKDQDWVYKHIMVFSANGKLLSEEDRRYKAPQPST